MMTSRSDDRPGPLGPNDNRRAAEANEAVARLTFADQQRSHRAAITAYKRGWAGKR